MSHQLGGSKVRPYSAGRKTDSNMKSQSGDVVSYEDLLVAQYLEELKRSQPLANSGFVYATRNHSWSILILCVMHYLVKYMYCVQTHMFFIFHRFI